MSKLSYRLLTSCLLFSGMTSAQNLPSVNGVVSAGFIATSDNNFVDDEDGGDTFLTENIVRIASDFKNNLSWSGQIVYREAGINYDSGISVDFLQLDYKTAIFDDGEQTFTLGRFKSRQGLYNETRDIPFSRPSILLPQSVYLDNARNFQLNLDGLKLRSYHALDDSDITVELAIGKNRFDDKFSQVAIASSAKGDWRSETNYYGDIRWESQNWTLGLNLSDVSVNYTPSPSAFITFDTAFGPIQLPMTKGLFESQVIIGSLQFRQANWETTFEIIDRSYDTFGFVAQQVASKSKLDGYYLQHRYFINDNVTLLMRYDNAQYELPAVGSVNIARPEAEDLTLGISWNISQDWLISVEHHFIEGEAWLPPISNLANAGENSNDWTLSALQISKRF